MHLHPAPEMVTAFAHTASTLESLVIQPCMGEAIAVAEFLAQEHTHVLDYVETYYLRRRDRLRLHVDPEDVLQSAYVGLCRALARGRRFSGRRHLMAFILRLVRHCIADAARQMRTTKRGGDRQRCCNGRLHDVRCRNPDPSALAAAEEHLAMFLAAVSAEQARVARAKLEGLSADNIAHCMRVSKRKVQVLLATAYRRWKRLFGHPGDANRAER